MKARTSSVRRATRETDIAVDLTLDGTGACSIRTGIPFMNHMLELLGKRADVSDP